MAEVRETSHDQLLPVWQRLAWMAAIWSVSVATMVLISFLIRAWIT